MKFGLLYEIECSRSAGTTSIYDGFQEALEQVRLADELGFHVVWSVEPPGLDSSSASPAPEVWLSALAQHTERIRIGHAGCGSPLQSNHPIRTAEMAAVLDIMSEGRLDFGTRRAASVRALDRPGSDPNETCERWDEALRMISQMWTREAFSWDSETLQVPPRNVLPKPIQKPHPPLWTSGTGPDSAVQAGERGLGFLHFPMSDPLGLDETVRAYRKAIAHAEPAGSFVNDRFAAATCLFCGADDADAAKRAGEVICKYASFAGGGTTPRTLTELVDGHFAIVGGPERCIESIRWYEAQGADQVILLMQAGRLSQDDVCDSLRRFGREVMPRFAD